MNPVVRYNVEIVVAGLLYLGLVVLFVWRLNLPFLFKLLVIACLILTIPYLRLLALTITVYGMLVAGNKSLLPALSSHAFREHWQTRHNLYELAESKGVIFVTNYPCPFFNYLITHLLPTSTYVVGHDQQRWGVKLLASHHYTLKPEGNFDDLRSFIEGATAKGFNILAFVEEIHTAAKRDIHTLGRIKTGMFTIARDLRLPVVPIYIAPLPFTLGWPISHEHRIFAGPAMTITDPERGREQVASFFQSQADITRSK